MSRVQAAPVSTPAAPSMEVEEDKITDEMLSKMTKKAKESFKTRPKRSIPADPVFRGCNEGMEGSTVLHSS